MLASTCSRCCLGPCLCRGQVPQHGGQLFVYSLVCNRDAKTCLVMGELLSLDSFASGMGSPLVPCSPKIAPVAITAITLQDSVLVSCMTATVGQFHPSPSLSLTPLPSARNSYAVSSCPPRAVCGILQPCLCGTGATITMNVTATLSSKPIATNQLYEVCHQDPFLLLIVFGLTVPFFCAAPVCRKPSSCAKT